jgi:hypothetical protein
LKARESAKLADRYLEILNGEKDSDTLSEESYKPKGIVMSSKPTELL